MMKDDGEPVGDVVDRDTAQHDTPPGRGDKPGDAAPGKPQLVATFGDWGTYAAKVGTAKAIPSLTTMSKDTRYATAADAAGLAIVEIKARMASIAATQPAR